MNKNEFVERVKGSLRDSWGEELLESYEKPSGRSPTKKVKRISAWYHALSPEQKKGFEEVTKNILDSAFFHFFCVLDGVGFIRTPEWRYELYAVNEEGERVFLNDPDSGEEMLHDIYQGLTWSED